MMDIGRAIAVLPIPVAAVVLALIVAAIRHRGRDLHGRRARQRAAFFQFHRPGGGQLGQGEEQG